MRRSCITFLVLALSACGGGASDGAPGAGALSDPATDTNGTTGSGGSETGGGGGSSDAVATDLVGVWNVSGKDARGAYRGQAEIRSEGSGYGFYRTVKYDGVTVEDGRELHWAFRGTAKGDVRKELTIDVVLDSRAFIVARGGVVRTAGDAPLAIAGKVTFAGGAGKASYAGDGIGGDEVWEDRSAPAASPIFVVDRVVVPGHDPPSALEKQGLFSTYASFRALPAVAPYASRPELQAAIHGHVVDKTDFDFYRAHPNALRVIDKKIDAISLGEALSRANAYRKTLADKAAGFDAEVVSDFLDPTTGMILDAAPPGQPRGVHMSAALWTGVYAASQVLRWETTSDPQAKANVLATLDGILKLQEVTGDWKVFARAIRPATGSPTGGWHTGAGALSSLEWLEGGNNDMMKGLYIAYALGHRALCKAPGHESLCARIRTNAKHLADDVNVDRGTDELDSAWLAAVVAADPITKLTYQGKAEAAWTVYKTPITQNTTLYAQGTADWSGLNLGFVGNLFKSVLAESYDVGGDGKATYREVIQDSWQSLRRQRLPLWNLLQAAYGNAPADPASIDDALWRLREMPFPKSVQRVDHRISPEFCMSPYPSLPWKNDWTTTDRTQALRSVPLFEEALDIYRFRLEMRYAGDTTGRPPAPEYLVAYWFGRRYGLIGPAE